MNRRVGVIGLGLSVVLLGGCYSWEVIRPTELPKLNGSSAQVVGATGSGGYVAISTVAHVERPDGTMTEIKGRFDARVTADGRTQEFEHPVQSELEGADLKLRSANRAPAAIPLERIQRLEVSQFQPVQTTFAIMGLSLVASGLLVVALLAVGP